LADALSASAALTSGRPWMGGLGDPKPPGCAMDGIERCSSVARVAVHAAPFGAP